jgi:hypothetical protein
LRENKIALILDVECPDKGFLRARITSTFEESGPTEARAFSTAANIQKPLDEMQVKEDEN